MTRDIALSIALAAVVGHAGCYRSHLREPEPLPAAFVAQPTYVKASNTRDRAAFGSRVALSADGATLAVASSHETSLGTGIDGDESDAHVYNAGAVYVFARTEGEWAQQAYVKASNTAEFDFFGCALALSSDGSTLVVGALGESSSARGIDGDQADDSAEGAGAAYVFTRAGTRWSQQAYIKAWNADAGDMFGHEVALSADGRTLAVGAPGEGSSATGVGGDESDNSAPGAGAVYVFTRTIGGWTPEAYIKSETGDPDRFGGGAGASYTGTGAAGGALALSADGSVLAVGARGDRRLPTRPGGAGPYHRSYRVGAAYVFARTGTMWSQEAYLKASNAQSFDDFGSALALSGDGTTLAVSSPGEGSAATGVDGDQLEGAHKSGAAYVFSRVDARWVQQAYVKASNTGAEDAFGTSIALSADGAMLAVGAMHEDSRAEFGDDDQLDDSMPEAGAVYVFVRTGARWSQSEYVKAPNTIRSLMFGFSVALSGDAATLAVGAPGEGSDEVGVDGDHMFDGAPLSGAAYVY